MSEHTPHFLRCSWCAKYFTGLNAPEQTEPCGKPCCPECTKRLCPTAEQLSGESWPTTNQNHTPSDAALGANEDKHTVLITWVHCPVCHKPVQANQVAASQQYAQAHTHTTHPQHNRDRSTTRCNGKQNCLEIHLEHSRKEQQQKLQRKALAVVPKPSQPPSGSAKIAKQNSKSFCRQFSLKAWYPDGVDCSRLFWYSYALTI